MIQKHTRTPMLTAALFTTAGHGSNLCPLTEGWTKKVWHTHTTEYYSAIKKEGNNTNNPSVVAITG